MAIITQETENEQQVSIRTRSFFKRYQIGALLQKRNAYKHSGIPVVSIIMYLLCLVFRNRSMYLDMTSERKSGDFKQDTVYRLKNIVKKSLRQARNVVDAPGICSASTFSFPTSRTRSLMKS